MSKKVIVDMVTNIVDETPVGRRLEYKTALLERYSNNSLVDAIKERL